MPSPALESLATRLGLDPESTAVMGVINMSPESRNRHTVAEGPDQALRIARSYRGHGAAFVDLGAQSSHFENRELSVDEEWGRLRPALDALVADGFVVSIDTWKPEVAAAAAAAGAAILNDTGGLQSPRMVEVVASTGLPAVLMYLEGANPLDVDQLDLVEDKAAQVAERLRPRLDRLAGQGVTDLIVDPGLSINYRSDYAAYTQQQLRVIRRLDALRALGMPVLVPVPRKREFHRVVAYMTLSIEHGADIIRVHDVEAACDLVRLLLPGS